MIGRRTVDDHPYAFADARPLAPGYQTLLETHHARPPRPLELRRYVIAQPEGGGSFLMGVHENPNVVEGVVAHECAELRGVGLGFAREADDERGPERDAGDAGADPPEQCVV